MSTTPLALATQALDENRQAEFENRFVNALNEAGMLQLISLGHRSGLLERMADGEPVTTGELARDSEMSERYVREWLGGLTVSGVVEHDAERMTYRLPPEHASLLTDQTRYDLWQRRISADERSGP